MAAAHLMPTLSPSLTVPISEPGPSFCTMPTPSWPPIWPEGTGKGRECQPLVMMLRSLRQTPEC